MKMPIKKIEKAKNPQLKEGEQVTGAMFLNTAGSVAASATTGGVGGILGFALGRKMQMNTTEKLADQTNDTAMSNQIPDGSTWVATTDQGRFLIYSHDSIGGKAKELLGELATKDVSLTEFKKGKLISKVTLTFSDGGSKVFDAPKLNNIEEFQQVLG